MILFRTHDKEQRNIAVAQSEDKRQVWLNVAQHFIDCILDDVNVSDAFASRPGGSTEGSVSAASVISARTVDFR